jgi:hypothetical protein
LAQGFRCQRTYSVSNSMIFGRTEEYVFFLASSYILMGGIPGTISMRIPLILAGVSLLESYHRMVYIFAD